MIMRVQNNGKEGNNMIIGNLLMNKKIFKYKTLRVV